MWPILSLPPSSSPPPRVGDGWGEKNGEEILLGFFRKHTGSSLPRIVTLERRVRYLCQEYEKYVQYFLANEFYLTMLFFIPPPPSETNIRNRLKWYAGVVPDAAVNGPLPSLSKKS